MDKKKTEQDRLQAEWNILTHRHREEERQFYRDKSWDLAKRLDALEAPPEPQS